MAMADTNTNPVQAETAKAQLSTEAALWRIVVAEYEKEGAAYAAAAKDYETAMDAFDKAFVPVAKPEDFDTYNLDHYANYHRNDRAAFIRSIEFMVAMQDYRLEDGEHLTDEQCAAIRAKATRLVDDFTAWTDAKDEANAPARAAMAAAEKKHDEACGRIFDARRKLLSTPAPDKEAMLAKLELLASTMNEYDEEDAPFVASINDDAKRLLGKPE